MDECTCGICIPQESKSIRSRFWEQCNGSIHHSNDSWSSKIANARNQSKWNAICIMLHINLNCHGCASQYYLNLQASLESDLPSESYSLHLGSNRMRSGQLESVVFRSFPISVNELTIIKFVLACSPLLKKLYIKLCTLNHDHAENVVMNWELARELLKLHRASPTAVVEFI